MIVCRMGSSQTCLNGAPSCCWFSVNRLQDLGMETSSLIPRLHGNEEAVTSLIPRDELE